MDSKAHAWRVASRHMPTRPARPNVRSAQRAPFRARPDSRSASRALMGTSCPTRERQYAGPVTRGSTATATACRVVPVRRATPRPTRAKPRATHAPGDSTRTSICRPRVIRATRAARVRNVRARALPARTSNVGTARRVFTRTRARTRQARARVAPRDGSSKRRGSLSAASAAHAPPARGKPPRVRPA